MLILNTSFIILENTPIAFFKLKGITFHSNNPFLVITAVFHTSLGTMQICQNPNCKSNIFKMKYFPSWENTSSIKGKGYASILVCWLRGLYFPQDLHKSSFFIERVTLHVYSKLLGYIFPKATKTSICFLISPFPSKDTRLGVVLHGESPKCQWCAKGFSKSFQSYVPIKKNVHYKVKSSINIINNHLILTLHRHANKKI